MDVHNPETNKELIAKQLLLLETHATVPDAWCPECASKHLLTAEALAEEGVQLGDESMSELAQKIRALRKEVLGTKEHSHSNPEPEVEVGEKVWVEHFEAKEACDPESFRVVKPNPEHILTVCCPSGEYDKATGRCKVGMVRQKLEHLHPKEEGGSCPVCGEG